MDFSSALTFFGNNHTSIVVIIALLFTFINIANIYFTENNEEAFETIESLKRLETIAIKRLENEVEELQRIRLLEQFSNNEQVIILRDHVAELRLQVMKAAKQEQKAAIPERE